MLLRRCRLRIVAVLNRSADSESEGLRDLDIRGADRIAVLPTQCDTGHIPKPVPKTESNEIDKKTRSTKSACHHLLRTAQPGSPRRGNAADEAAQILDWIPNSHWRSGITPRL